eukprot:CAMPEP_0197053738 /NCGR_PEP_ID=MMETSP1384-20130603/27916_1 /TAXON_ID=29189 /ORGANISM="Ammonia sp." /LENGTH=178 /DNA_ID=CAMNT_0042486679 /DNA_START=128 /DNA_END=661 /DNA_ORIENTATION=-
MMMMKRFSLSQGCILRAGAVSPVCALSRQSFSGSSASKKKRSGPKYVDPNYPKRPLNGYLRFWLQFQTEFMEKNKNVNLVSSAKIAGQEWYHLGDIQRQQYEAAAQPEWQKFREEVQQYRENNGLEKWNETKKSLPRKNYPKSPVAIYIRENFLKESENAANAEKSAKDVVKSLAEKW